MRKFIIAAVVAISSLVSIAANAEYVEARIADQGTILFNPEKLVIVPDHGENATYQVEGVTSRDVNGQHMDQFIYRNIDGRYMILTHNVTYKWTLIGGYTAGGRQVFQYKLDDRYTAYHQE